MSGALSSLRERFSTVGDKAKQDVRVVEQNLETEAERMKRVAGQAVDRLKSKEERVRRSLREDAFATPFYPDIGAEYDVTFEQPTLLTKRIVLSSPNILAGSSFPNSYLSFSTVHDGEDGAQDQLTSNFHWRDVFGPKSVRSPAVSVPSTATGGPTKARVGLDWKRPLDVSVSGYAALPTKVWRPTAKIGMEVTDVKSKLQWGLAARQSGGLWTTSWKTRLPYVTLSGSFKNDNKSPDVRVASVGMASTLYRDSLHDSSLSIGVGVDSGAYSLKDALYPKQLANITAKIEYDEPKFTVDSVVRASSYKNAQSQEQTFKISEAFLRGVYCVNLGTYPRYCVGGAIGLIDSTGTEPALMTEGGETALQSTSGVSREFQPYEDPDAFVENGAGGMSSWRKMFANGATSELNFPLAAGHFYYQLNPTCKFKTRVTSARQLTHSFQYRFAPNVTFQASLNTLLPSWDIRSLMKGAGGEGAGQIRNTLGLSISVGAM